MKKTIFLIAFFCLLTILAGCGRDEYSIEKRYWKTQKLADKIFKNPHAVPPMELERVVKGLNNFSQKYPNTKLAVAADFTIAKLYIIKEDYDTARAQLNKLITKYNKSKDLIAQSIYLIGNSYEIQDRWTAALEQYRRIMRDYSETVMGLDIPVYIAQHYKVKYQPDKMIASFQEAINYYKAIAARHPNSPLAFNIDLLVARCYAEIKDWQGAVNTFKNMLVSYKGKVNLDSILLNTAGIYYQQLNDKPSAKKFLEQLLKDYPKSNFKKAAETLLKKIEKND